MKNTNSETLDLDEMRQQNSHAINNLRLLYMALNDLDAFEREVLERPDICGQIAHPAGKFCSRSLRG